MSKIIPPNPIYEDLQQGGWQVFYSPINRKTFCTHPKYGDEIFSVPCARADTADIQFLREATTHE